VKYKVLFFFFFAKTDCLVKMDDQFPSTDLLIKVISVVNTDKPTSSEPESMEIAFKVDRDVDPSKTMEAIMSLIEERVPALHCQLYEDII
jgi:hypothetical protein